MGWGKEQWIRNLGTPVREFASVMELAVCNLANNGRRHAINSIRSTHFRGAKWVDLHTLLALHRNNRRRS